MEIGLQSLHLNCIKCQWSFKANDMDRMNNVDEVKETGICPACIMLCSDCGNRAFQVVPNNIDKLCSQCFQYMTDNAVIDGDEESSQSGFEEHDKQMDLEEVTGDITAIEDSNIPCFDNILIPGAEDFEEVTDYAIVIEASYIHSLDYILIPCKHVVDLTAEVTNDEKKYYHKIVSAYNKSSGNLGSDGNGGSTNGEMAVAGCQTIATALKLNSNDFLCDLGSGGGISLMLLLAMSHAKAGVGIEIEAMRYNLAMNYQKYLLTKELSVDIPVAFLHKDIMDFDNLNGVTKVFMYDEVFPPNLLNKITGILNSTTSIQYVVTTQPSLVDFGFNGKMLRNLGCLKARGGAMSHSFYLYESNGYEDECAEWNTVIKAAIDTATNRNARKAAAVDYIKAFHKSDVSPRVSTIKKILGDSNSKSKSYEVLYELFDRIKVNEEIVIDSQAYKLTSTPTRAYVRFNEKLLSNNSIQMDAILHKQNNMAVIAPSYDGKEDGSGMILVAIVYDPSGNAGSYYAHMYSLEHQKFVKESLMSVITRFDHNNSMPCDITDIRKKFRTIYPLAPATSAPATNGPRLSTIQNIERYSPPDGTRKRNRTQIIAEAKAQSLRDEVEKTSNSEAEATRKREKDLMDQTIKLKNQLKESEQTIRLKDQQLVKSQSSLQEQKRKMKETEANKAKSVDQQAQLTEIPKRQRTNVMVVEPSSEGDPRITELTKNIAQLTQVLAAPVPDVMKLTVENAVQKKEIEWMTTYNNNSEAHRNMQQARDDKHRQDEIDRIIASEKAARDEREKSQEGLYGLLRAWAPK